MDQNEIDALVDDVRDGMMHAWEKSGWVQGMFGSDEGGFCMMGAFMRATGQSGNCLTPVWRQAVKETAENLFPGRPVAVESFNDMNFTSEEDVKMCTKHAFERMKELLAVMVNGPQEQ